MAKIMKNEFERLKNLPNDQLFYKKDKGEYSRKNKMPKERPLTL